MKQTKISKIATAALLQITQSSFKQFNSTKNVIKFYVNPFKDLSHILIFRRIVWIVKELTIALKMVARNFLPRCIAFFNRIPIETLKNRYSKAAHLGK